MKKTIALFWFMLALAVVNQVSAQIPSDGLVGYWPFTGNANDASGNGNNGIIYASLTTDRFGNPNSAYNFNQGSKIEVPMTQQLFELPVRSFSCWFRLSANQTGGRIYETTFQNGGIGFYAGSIFDTWYGYSQHCCNIVGLSGGPIGLWHHLVVNSNDNTGFTQVYLDGVQISTSNGYPAGNGCFSNTVWQWQGAFMRFGQGASGEAYFGDIDDISIYNRVLTPAEISQLYTDQTSLVEVPCVPFLGEDQTVCAGTSVTLSASSASTGVTCPTLPSNLQTGLVGYWPFCGNANDESGNGNNGTVNGATLTTDRFGNANSAYVFDNSSNTQDITLSTVPIIGGQNWSISFYFKTSSSLRQGLITLGNGSITKDCIQIFIADNLMHYDLHNQSGPASNINIVDNQWHFVVVSNLNGSGTLYLDGIFQNSFTNMNPIISNSGTKKFGRDRNEVGSQNRYNGVLDDITIHNRALSASEIQQLYTLGQTTYQWSTGATTSSINVTPTTTTTYTCIVTDANGNACTDSVTVYVPEITSTDLNICAGESTTFSVSGINTAAVPSTCPTLPANLQTGLVGYWPFCGNANDASGNGNNGTVNGATLTTDRFGNANSAYSFDGLNDLIYCNADLPVGSSPRTLVSWFKTEADFIPTSQYPDLQQISGWGNPYSGPVIFNQWVKSPSGKGYFESGSGGNQVYSVNAVNDNQWHQFVTTYGGAQSKVKIYIDGVAQDSSSNVTLMTASSYFGIGNCPFANTPFQGFIDDVVVWNHALTSSEIQQLYSSGQTTYLWSNGATTPTINVSPTVTTTYTCTVTTNGVSCTDSVTVIVNNPTIDLGADVTACGTSTSLTAPVGYDSYAWSNGVTSNTTTVTSNGTYTCTVTQGGCSASDSIDVTLIDATITATDTVVCAGETVNLSVPQGGSTSTVCAALPANLQTGLVGYWPFCGNANDESGNGNNGTVGNQNLVDDRFNYPEGAYHFNRDFSKIQIPNSILPLNPSSFSIALWLKPEIMTTFSEMGNYSSDVLCDRSNSSWFYKYRIIYDQYVNGEMGIRYYSVDENSGSGLTYTFMSLEMNWINVAIICDFASSERKLYVDGVLVDTDSGPIPYPILGNTTTVGGNVFPGSLNGDPSFLGDIDDLAFWNRALTLAEIQQLYTLGQTTYLWSNGATTPTIDVSPTVTTTYTCTITTNGVFCTDSVTVVVNNPTIDLGADVTACGTSTALTAAVGLDSYAWSNGATSNTTTVTSNGTYTCTVTQGGCSATDSIDVTLIDATITATDTVVCAGETVTLSIPQGSSTSTTCAALPANLQTGLVGYWPFCGNANDESGNGNTLSESYVSYDSDRFGIPNSSFYSNGIELGQGSSMTSSYPVFNIGQSEYTIGLWMKVQNTSQITRCLFNTIPHTGIAMAYNDNNAPGYVVYDVGPANAFWTNLYLHGPTNNYQPNDWHYVVLKKQGLNYSQYIDGQLEHSYTNPAAAAYNYDVNFRLSGISPEYQIFHGNIDDVHIYNRALSESEILQHYNLSVTDITPVTSTYLWSNGATTPTNDVSPTETTTYTCTITTNGVSCTDSITVVVSQPVASITPNGIVEICQGQSIALTANGGVSYLWNTGAPTQSITVNTEAVYTVTVTDAYGCTDTESQLVKVNFPPNIGVNNASICPGQSTSLTATGGLSYVWSPATGLSSTTGTSVTASPSTSTVYTVTGTGANGCTNTATAVVTVNALPTATITPVTATTFCQGGSVVLNANTGTGLSYQWRLNGTNISGATSSSYTANASGSYTVVVTNASTCSATSTAMVVTVNALPTATITASSATTFCQGGSVVLNANTGAGLSYQWFNNAVAISGATTSSYTANASGSYTVVVTNTSTCSATSTATVVTVNALPTATITASSATTFCQGGSVVLTANTGTGLSYQWRLNGTNISGATSSSYTANASGSYTVVVTNASTCSATSTAMVVTVNTPPTATITPATATTFCQGGSVVLNANTGTGLSYQWRLNGTNISGATSSSFTAIASGSYTVVVTNASACSATSTATVVIVNALPAATITPAATTTFCQGESVVLNANTGTGLSYQWRLNGTNITGATSSSYTANASGSYTVVVTNASACSATSTAIVVTVNALPTATITPATATTFCQGGSVVLNANTGSGLSYQWYNNAVAISGATSSSYTANASGSYTVVVTNTSTCSSTSTATVVTVNALPTATITPATTTTFCQGGSVVLNANTGTGLAYQWYNNASVISGATSASYTANASGSYSVVVTNTSTCSATSTATVVTVNALPTATITASSATTFCQGGSVVLNANTGAGLSYQWFNNAVAISGATTSSYTANASGSYTVVVTNASSCSATSTSVDVTTIPNIDYYADVDGDGFGDPATLISTCIQPQGYVTNNTDCDDTNASINTTASEICNDLDDNCNSLIDDGLTFTNYYADADNDGFGDGNATSSCSDLGAGYVLDNTDCDDTNASINTAASEICNDLDDNCNSLIDDRLTFTNYYGDADNDGFGAGNATSSCSDLGVGYVLDNTDCNDTNGNTYPGATEICNTIDDNCDGQIDEGVQTVYFIDNDGDTYGNPSVSILACTQPAGYTTDNTDCDDTNASVNPAAEEIASNGIDENCDGQIDNSIFELNTAISLFPNPSRSELNIQVNSSIIGNDLYIFDAVGKLVYKQQLLTTQTVLNVSNFADGNYLVRIGEVMKRFEVIK